jgi:hypothetical protein
MYLHGESQKNRRERDGKKTVQINRPSDVSQHILPQQVNLPREREREKETNNTNQGPLAS